MLPFAHPGGNEANAYPGIPSNTEALSYLPRRRGAAQERRPGPPACRTPAATATLWRALRSDWFLVPERPPALVTRECNHSQTLHRSQQHDRAPIQIARTLRAPSQSSFLRRPPAPGECAIPGRPGLPGAGYLRLAMRLVSPCGLLPHPLCGRILTGKGRHSA